MQITLYSGFSKRRNSLKIPSGGANVDVRLKSPTSIITPSFLLNSTNTGFTYIKWGSRYYYVTDITIESNDHMTITGALDVLATYRSQILASSQMVARSTSDYNGLLVDDKYPCENVADVRSILLPNIDNATGSGVYIVGVANEDAETGVCYYVLSPANFKAFIGFMFGGGWLSSDPSLSVELQKELINPFQYIISAMWYPFSVYGEGIHSPKFGYWTYTGINCGILSESERLFSVGSDTVALPRHPLADAGNRQYLNGSPFTRYLLNLWSFGQIPLDPLYFMYGAGGNNIKVNVSCDLFTGNGDLYIRNNDNVLIAHYTTQLGVPIQVSQVTQNGLGAAVSAISSAASVVGGVASGNLLMAGVGAASGITSALNNLMPQVQTGGSIGSKSAYELAPSITCTFYSPTNSAPAKWGRPLMQYRTLAGLSGYVQTIDASVDCSGTPEEKTAINTFLDSGVYIE